MKRSVKIILILTVLLFSGCGSNVTLDQNETSTNGLDTQKETVEIEEDGTTEEDESITTESKDALIETEVELEEEKSSEMQGEQYSFNEFESPKTMYTNTAVNVRTLPDASGDKVVTLSAKEPVEVLGKCNETGWYKIKYNNMICYISYTCVNEEVPTTNNTANNSDDISSNQNPSNNNSANDNASTETPTLNKYEQMEKDYVQKPGEANYASAILTSSQELNLTKQGAWIFEAGRKYYVWKVDNTVTGDGHWEAAYKEAVEGNNTWELEDLKYYLDARCAIEMPTTPGTYDGEEYWDGYTLWIYLGGGPSGYYPIEVYE